MLKIVGTYLEHEWDGKKPVSAMTLAKIFNVPSGKNTYEIEVLPTKIRKTMDGPTVPASSQVSNQFTVNTANGTFTVIYYESESGKEGEKTYRPHRIGFRGSGQLFQAQEHEKFVFMYLHPSCKDSPFVGINPGWQYKNRQAEAAAQMNVTKKHLSVVNRLIQMGEAELKILGHGLNIAGLNIPVQSMTGDEIRAQLIAIHGQFRDEFTSQYENKDTQIRGVLLYALEMGLIRMETTSGSQNYVYGTSGKDGDILCRVATADPFMSLLNYARQNYEEVVSYLYGLIIPRDISEKKMQAIAEFSPKTGVEKVKFALSEGKIQFNPVSKHVFALKGESLIQITKTPLKKVETWIADFGKVVEGDSEIEQLLK
jgi:hypothetical protein